TGKRHSANRPSLRIDHDSSEGSPQWLAPHSRRTIQRKSFDRHDDQQRRAVRQSVRGARTNGSCEDGITSGYELDSVASWEELDDVPSPQGILCRIPDPGSRIRVERWSARYLGQRSYLAVLGQ